MRNASAGREPRTRTGNIRRKAKREANAPRTVRAGSTQRSQAEEAKRIRIILTMRTERLDGDRRYICRDRRHTSSNFAYWKRKTFRDISGCARMTRCKARCLSVTAG